MLLGIHSVVTLPTEVVASGASVTTAEGDEEDVSLSVNSTTLIGRVCQHPAKIAVVQSLLCLLCMKVKHRNRVVFRLVIHQDECFRIIHLDATETGMSISSRGIRSLTLRKVVLAIFLRILMNNRGCLHVCYLTSGLT